MDIHTFYKTSTKAEVAAFCADVEISIEQFRNYANGYARPNSTRALKFVAASKGKMALLDILKPDSEMPKLYKYNKRNRATGTTST